MIKFDCNYRFEREKYERSWQCSISRLVYFGSHLEITVETDEPVTVIVGKTSSGFFVFFRSHVTGADLTTLFDISKSIPQLSSVCFDEKKAVSVAFAIKCVAYLLASPKRKRKRSHYNNYKSLDADDIPF